MGDLSVDATARGFGPLRVKNYQGKVAGFTILYPHFAFETTKSGEMSRVNTCTLQGALAMQTFRFSLIAFLRGSLRSSRHKRKLSGAVAAAQCIRLCRNGCKYLQDVASS